MQTRGLIPAGGGTGGICPGAEPGRGLIPALLLPSVSGGLIHPGAGTGIRGHRLPAYRRKVDSRGHVG